MPCPHGTIELYFCNWKPMQSKKVIHFLKVCTCGMLCVNFQSVAVNSAVMEFWPLPLEQRIKLFLNLISSSAILRKGLRITLSCFRGQKCFARHKTPKANCKLPCLPHLNFPKSIGHLELEWD